MTFLIRLKAAQALDDLVRADLIAVAFDLQDLELEGEGAKRIAKIMRGHCDQILSRLHGIFQLGEDFFVEDLYRVRNRLIDRAVQRRKCTGIDFASFNVLDDDLSKDPVLREHVENVEALEAPRSPVLDRRSKGWTLAAFEPGESLIEELKELVDDLRDRVLELALGHSLCERKPANSVEPARRDLLLVLT